MSRGVIALLILAVVVGIVFLVPPEKAPMASQTSTAAQAAEAAVPSAAVMDTQPVAPEIVYVTVVVTAEPEFVPTQTAQPPLPTYTPYPIPEPTIEYQEAPVFCLGWCGWAVLGSLVVGLVVVLLVGILLAFSAHRDRLATIADVSDNERDQALAEAEVAIAVANASRPIIAAPRDRIVPVHTNGAVTGVAADTITIGDLTIDKGKLITFITRSLSEDIGLKIGQWKGEGWSQEDLEKLLDIMADVELINPRQTGVACEYIGKPDAAKVLRELGRYNERA